MALDHVTRGIRWKLLVTMIGLIVTLVTILTTGQIISQTESSKRALDQRVALMRVGLKDRGIAMAENLAHQFDNDIAAFNLSNVESTLTNAVHDPTRALSYAILMNRERMAFVHTRHPELQQTVLESPADVEAAGSTERATQEIGDGPDAVLEVTFPVTVSGAAWGSLRLGFPLKSLNQEIDKTRLEMSGQTRSLIVRTVVTSSVFILVSAMVVMWFSTRLTQPIVQLTGSARRLAEGKFDTATHIRVKSKDEVGVLSDAFVKMAENLKKSYAKLEDYSQHLEQMVEQRTQELAKMTVQAEDARRQAVQASEAKSSFLANMSHELRTPLNAIIGYSEMLSEDAEDAGQDDVVADLKKIHGAGKHLLALINDILDLSKIEAGKMTLYAEDFDLYQLVREVQSTIQPLVMQKDNRLEIDCPTDIGTVHLDLTKTRQIIFNLLSNACKFTQGGTVRLRASRSKAERHDMLEIAVQDSGIGMTKEQMARLFQAFSQADASTTRQYGGTGLGLAISRKFCQMMGGDITVSSEPGTGSTFTIKIPASLIDPGITQEEGDQPADPGLEGEVVLTIDDDATVRELVRRYLSKEGYHVITASNGVEGLEMAQKYKPRLITLDVMMPQMDGWTVLTRLKADKDLCDIPVILMTIADDKNLGFSLGAAEYLTKPIEWSRLSAVLDRYRHGMVGNRAIVVEDSTSVREYLSELLGKDGWEVRQADSGLTALKLVEEKTPDIILLDLGLPGMDGFEFVHELRRKPEFWRIPIIVITGRDLSDEDRERLSTQVKKVLQKGSFGAEEFRREVTRLVRPEGGRGLADGPVVKTGQPPE